MSTDPSAAERLPIRRALISVYDKTDIVPLGQALAAEGVELVSTGSTATTLAEAGLEVTEVAEVTGFPEILDGRVKTLHPAIHAGLLADVGSAAHRDQLAELGIAPFELVVSNLYPFSATVASGASVQESIEQIDIGGPAMVRAAAKNHANVAVITSPEQYGALRAAVDAGGFTLSERQRLAAVAYGHTASYDVAVATWMGQHGAGAGGEEEQEFPTFAGAAYQRAAVLRYGENPHQHAALYRTPGGTGLAAARQLHGKEMSYNNYVDTDAARRSAYDFDEPAVAIIKHANPCGIALGRDIAEAHRKALACDPTSAFGGVVAANRPVSEPMARQIAEVFTEVVVAPGFEPGALEVLTTKKNIRLLEVGADDPAGPEMRQIEGGILVQTRDRVDAEHDQASGWRLACGQPAASEVLADLEFAWRAVRSVKSNAILLAYDRAAIGIGMGQVNRLDSARLAVQRAGDRVGGSVAASDAYFPFPDGLEILLQAGVAAVVQPGGSMRDEEVIEAARKTGITMYLTGARHFYH